MVLIGRLICWLRGQHNFQLPVIDPEHGGPLYASIKVCTFCGKPQE